MKIFIDPMEGFCDEPQVHVIAPNPDLSNAEYTKSGDCYWYQDVVTDFMYHSGSLRAAVDLPIRMITTQDEGYGGCSFRIKVKDIGLVELRGPWFSGCYLANIVLPKPAMEVIWGVLALKLTVETINEVLKDSRWHCVVGEKHGSKVWPYMTWNGQPKENLRPDVISILQKQFNDNCHRLIMTCGRS